MLFASLGGTSNYAQAGKAVADDAARIFDTTRKHSVNFGELAQTSRDMQSRVNAAISKADSDVAQTKVKSDAKVKINKEEIYRDELKAKTRRKAGVVAALGKAGAGLADVFMGKPKKRDHSSSIALQEKLTKSADELSSGIKPININGGVNTSITGSTNTGGTNTGGTATSSSSTTGASAGGTTTAFTPEQVKAFDITGLYESDSSGGYNAFNLGGSKGGTVAHGSGDSSKNNVFGKPLTQMTIGEVRQLGQSGKIHATGRYQFTHNTGSFGEAVNFAGLQDSDMFNEENQNRMFLAFGKKYGTSRWVGLNLSLIHI